MVWPDVPPYLMACLAVEMAVCHAEQQRHVRPLPDPPPIGSTMGGA